MKKYISIILIQFILLLLCGCYSMNEISYEELKDFDGSNEIIIRTNEDEYLVYRNSDQDYALNWIADDSLITIISNEHITRDNMMQYNYTLVPQYITINKMDIKSIEVDEFNLLKTTLSLVGISFLISLIYEASIDAGTKLSKFP